MFIASLGSSYLSKCTWRSIVTYKLLWPSKVCTVFGFWSVLFALYSAQELAAASDPFLATQAV